MNAVIIYNSKTGFTRRYANWLSDGLECPAIPVHQVKESDYKDAALIIFASWLHAGRISKLDWFEALPLAGKSRALLVVGAAPEGVDQIRAALAAKKGDIKDIPAFYAQGGLNYEKMTFGDKVMMKMFSSMLRKKKDKSPQEAEMARVVSRSFDGSDKAWLEPLIVWAKEIAK